MQVLSPTKFMRELFNSKSSVIKKSPIKGALPEWDQLENKKEIHLQQGKNHKLHEYRAKNSVERWMKVLRTC